jgi:Flp pilus assembly protein TadG
MGKFLKNASGNAAMLFAAAAVPLILAAGMGVDMVRANHVQTVLQGAADAAAVAGAASGKTSIAEIRKIVEEYAAANGVNNALDLIDSIEPKQDKKTRTFSVTIKGKMDTSLMRLANISVMDITAFSEVTMGGAALELVLVLDTTASMNAEGRMVALKDAADDLVQDLMKLEKDGVDMKIGIVPFGQYVNVGMANRNKSWLDVPADSSEPYCGSTYPNPVLSTCSTVSQSGYVDGVFQTWSSYQCGDWGKPVEVCGTHNITWNGCVGSRKNPLDEVISGLGDRYTGLMNTWCASPIVTLTDDEKDLRDSIQNLTPSGNTYIPSGLIWGWNTINANEPFKDAKTQAEMAALGGTKAIVLMTDGANTLSATYPEHNGSDVDVADAKTRDICGNIKADGVTVFTVSFMVDSSAAQDVLDECASDAGKSYSADDAAELAKAFKDIGTSLAAMRISQ